MSNVVTVGSRATHRVSALGFNLNFFGVNFNSVYINTNGNITLDSPLSTFTPFGLTATSRKIVAPFFAYVDTRNPASGVATFGSGTFHLTDPQGYCFDVYPVRRNTAVAQPRVLACCCSLRATAACLTLRVASR